jgi:hypothetical protein
MTVTPHDIGTYRVSSRTRAEIEHIVDLSNPKNPQCSCEAVMDFKTQIFCAHIERALFHQSGKPTKRENHGSILALLFTKNP